MILTTTLSSLILFGVFYLYGFATYSCVIGDLGCAYFQLRQRPFPAICVAIVVYLLVRQQPFLYNKQSSIVCVLEG